MRSSLLSTIGQTVRNIRRIESRSHYDTETIKSDNTHTHAQSAETAGIIENHHATATEKLRASIERKHRGHDEQKTAARITINACRSSS